jgi:tRNA threonylcarbamoyladenosine biosynthesis protein TsaB
MSFDNRGLRMNLIAFDTSTEILSAAVARDGKLVAEQEVAGGPRASAALVPMVQALLAQAGLAMRSLDAIVFGRGPGSFTGLRTACAVAQGLGFGAGVPVLGLETLLVVAEEARFLCGATQVVTLLDARMNEVYCGRYRHDGSGWQREGDVALMRPQDVFVPQGWVLAGNAFAAYGDVLPSGVPRVEAAPRAAAMLRIAPRRIELGDAQPADRAAPVYIRDKVAQTTEERAAARAQSVVTR